MKKLITALLVPILCLTINMNVFASPATTPTSNPDELLNELNQEMEEINHYIKTNIQPCSGTDIIKTSAELLLSRRCLFTNLLPDGPGR